MQSISLAATGHRPDKIGGHNTVTEARLAATAGQALDSLMQQYRIEQLICGMALGWDLAVGQAAQARGIPLIAAIPCPQQPSRWPPLAIARWSEVKRRAAAVQIISPEYTAECMQARNVWMVDRADLILALYNGTKGGTRNCLQYARSLRKPIVNVWKQYQLETL